MSAEPSADRAGHIIPQGILESSIKITNEPPTGMMANLHKALDNFNQVCMVCMDDVLGIDIGICPFQYLLSFVQILVCVYSLYLYITIPSSLLVLLSLFV